MDKTEFADKNIKKDEFDRSKESGPTPAIAIIWCSRSVQIISIHI